MRVYEFTAPYFEVDSSVPFLGFSNKSTNQYFWMQRGDVSPEQGVPEGGDIWIERDDQAWGGHGGIARVILGRKSFTIHLTPAKAEYMGGYDVIRVLFSFKDEEFEQIRKQFAWIMRGNPELVEIVG